MKATEISFSELLEYPQIASNGIMFWEGSSTELHYHNFFEMTVVLNGKVDAIFNGNIYEIMPNTLVMIRPYDVHYKKISQGTICCSLAMTNDNVYKIFDFYGLNIKKPLQFPGIPIVKLSEYASMLINNQREKIAGRKLNEEYVATIDAKVLFSMLIANFYEYLTDMNDTPKWLQQLIIEMDKIENFSEGISAMERISGKTHEHLCRVFKKHLNMSPSQYINSIKISHSAEMLAKTKKDIISIMLEVGFSSPSYFYKCFSEKYGVAPNVYRNLSKK